MTTNIYYFIGRKFFSNRIGTHHLINVAVYLANGFLLYLISLRLLAHPWALVPPGIWVSRFSHVEVVINTCEFQTLLSVFFTLLAFYLFIAGRKNSRPSFEKLALAAFILALFSKETALVLPALLVIYGWLFDEPGAWRHYVAMIAAGGVWVILFAVYFRGVTHHQPTGFTYSVSLPHLLQGCTAYFLTFFNSLTFRLESIVMVPGVAAATSVSLVKTGVAALSAVVIVSFALHRRLGNRLAPAGRVLVLGFLFFVIGVAPYVILESRLFMRYGYFGHAGLAIASAIVLHQAAAVLARIPSGFRRSRLMM